MLVLRKVNFFLRCISVASTYTRRSKLIKACGQFSSSYDFRRRGARSANISEEHFVVLYFELQSLKSREHAMKFHWLYNIDKSGSARFSRRPHTVRNLPREAKKYQTRQIFSSRPRKVKNSRKFHRTLEETAELTASRDFLLNVRWALCVCVKVWNNL